MSWSERCARARTVAAAGLALLAAGCTVQPLYMAAPQAVPGQATMVSAMSAIEVREVATREAQLVRNRLIFLLSGGQGNPQGAPYELELRISGRSTATAIVQVDNTTQASTQSLYNMTGTFVLRDTVGGEVVVTDTVRVSSGYDVPSQRFAAQRAFRDAQDRAGRELAQLIQIRLAQALARAPTPLAAEQ